MFINPVSDTLLNKDIFKAIDPNNDLVNNLSERVLFSEARKSISKKIKNNQATHIYIGSNKGGVGKTMTALQLSWFLVARGYKVLLADLDPQANITCSLLEDLDKTESDISLFDVLVGDCELSDIIFPVSEGFDLLAGNEMLSQIDHYLRNEEVRTTGHFHDVNNSSNEIYLEIYEKFKAMGEGYDYVVYDTHPETNKLNRLSMQICDLAIIPVQARESSAKAYKITEKEILASFKTINRKPVDINNRIKILYNNLHSIPAAKKQKVLDMVFDFYSGVILKNYIDYSWSLSEVSDNGWPIFAHDEIARERREGESEVEFKDRLLIVESVAGVVDDVLKITESFNTKKSGRSTFLTGSL